MSAVRGAVCALGLDPRTVLPADGVLERVNRALHSITPAHQFMSLLYGVIDARQKIAHVFQRRATPRPC